MAVNPPCDFHILPANDVIEHDHSGAGECVCGPTDRPIKRDDGSVGWIVVHHSLDGREASE